MNQKQKFIIQALVVSLGLPLFLGILIALSGRALSLLEVGTIIILIVFGGIYIALSVWSLSNKKDVDWWVNFLQGLSTEMWGAFITFILFTILVSSSTPSQKTNLGGADLHGASLEGANLQNVVLIHANLQGAILTGADLQGANLQGASLQDAHFDSETVLDENTILPSGSKWTIAMDQDYLSKEFGIIFE